DITLTTAFLQFEAQHGSVGGRLSFLYEEDATDLEVDEGYIAIGSAPMDTVDAFYVPTGEAGNHYFLSAGQMYLPFGNFFSAMLSDPLTLELGETRETALMAGFSNGGLYAAGYFFNGDAEKTGKDNQINQFGLTLGYSDEAGGFSYDLGLGWLNSLADTDAMQNTVADAENMEDYTGGLQAHAVFGFGGFELIAEYLGATGDFAAADLAFNGQGASPQAWNLELDYHFKAQGRDMTVALGYQQTREALALELPESRILAAYSVDIFPNTGLAFEYAHDNDYDQSHGGTGEEGHAVTVQLSYEFP
ncbi:MAG: LbtU family siderophore porin, partial [Gammaproteobacteria bacterium]|nr:LbtU family siderophore porin [Gammaproteobacteria bacterium]